MCGFTNKNKVGKYPLTKIQCEAAFKLVAEIAKEYGLEITPQTVLTHYEFGVKNPKTSSHGKIDIVYLPPYPHVTQSEVGNFIRSKVRWYRTKI